MQIHQLAYFVAVAETGSFTRGAQRANVVQSAVSAAISQLERELGVALFERQYHRVSLTAEGEALLPRAREALFAVEAAREAVASARGELVGTVRLGMVIYTGSWDLAAVLHDFVAAHPRVDVRMRQTIAGSTSSLEEVRTGALDLALVFTAAAELPDFTLTELNREPLVLMCSPDHPLAGQSAVGIADLAREPFIDYPEGWGIRSLIDAAFAAIEVRRTIRTEVTDFQLARALVHSDLGVSIVPEQAIDDTVVGVPLREDLAWKVQLARPTHRRETAAAVALANAITRSAHDRARPER